MTTETAGIPERNGSEILKGFRPAFFSRKRYRTGHRGRSAPVPAGARGAAR